MKHILLVLVLWQIQLFGYTDAIEQSSLLRGPPIPQLKSNERNVEEAFIEQRLDNFDPSNTNRWQMRYLTNDQFFVRGGPIIIFVGAQWTINGNTILDNHIVDIAQELGGYLYHTEHRYYGLSHPTPDVSLENMRFFNSDQAVADLAHFITHIRQINPQFDRSEVILVGGAYSANIVTWTRQKYPHLSAGAWSSSAPVLLQFEFPEYNEVVGWAFQYLGGENCYQRLVGAFSYAEQLIANRNFAEFSSLFRTCEVISDDNPYDIMEMYTRLMRPLTLVVQHHRYGDITDVCESLLDTPDESDASAYARWFIGRTFGENVQPDDCINSSFDDNVEFHRNISWDSTAVRMNDRQWFFQGCSEFGWFRSSNGSQSFGLNVPIDYFLKFCRDVYGELFTPEFIQANIQRKNIMNGGLNPAVTNTYFTHGGIDPWFPVGIQEDLNPSSPVDIIPDTSHWQCLDAAGPSDSPELISARQRVIDLIRMWINFD